MTIGYNRIGQSGGGIHVRANDHVKFKPIGVTIDWSNVAAVSGSDVTLGDNIIIPIGSKYLRHGQVLCRQTQAALLTLTVTGTPDAGNLDYTITRPDTGEVVAINNLAYNASVATHQTAIDAAFGSGVLTVAGSGALPGNAHTLTPPSTSPLFGYTFATVTVSGADLTGGTAPAATLVITRPGTKTNKYGPYDPDATDGRQTLTNGECGILDTSVTEKDPVLLLNIEDSTLVGLIVGGSVFKDRLLATSGTHTLAAGPTFTELLAVMPTLQFVDDR